MEGGMEGGERGNVEIEGCLVGSDGLIRYRINRGIDFAVVVPQIAPALQQLNIVPPQQMIKQKQKLEGDEQRQDRSAHFQQHLQGFKSKLEQMEKEINRMPNNIDEFKNHSLPLARIKKIMKSDEDVRMISSETPVLFAKACEIFIVELTYRAWAFTLDSKRRTLQKSDVSACIYNTQIFDFLIDIIPKEDLKSLKKLPAEGMFNPIPK